MSHPGFKVAIFVILISLLEGLVDPLAAFHPVAAQSSTISERADNEELARLFEEDQADRIPPKGKSIEWTILNTRHRARLALVRGLYAQNKLQTGADYYRAAVLLQQGDGAEDHKLAHDLGIIARGKDGSIQLLQTGPEQDCSGAIPVCRNTYTQSQSYTGAGAVQEVSGTCLFSGETNSVWYVFTAQTNGSLTFTINTTNDYDFAMYNISNGGCAGVPGSTPIRCNYSGASGTTGLSLPAQPETPPPAYTGPIMPGVNVTAGQTYVLLVNNYTGNQNGYTLTFGGTATISGAFADAGPDRSICCCGPQKLQIGAPAIPGLTYSWSPITGLDDPASSSPTIDFSTFNGTTIPFPSVYEVTVTDASGCSSKDSVFIKTVCSCRPPAKVTVTRVSPCSRTFILKADCACGDTTGTYLWSPGGATTASIEVLEGTGPYTVTCRNECGATVSQPIMAPPAQLLAGGFPNIQCPNVFTPNGDSINDLWVALDLSQSVGFTPAYNATEYQFEVFDRWGRRVAFLSGSTTTGFANGSIPGWNGIATQSALYNWLQHLLGRKDTHAGSPVSDGTYFYIFRLRNCTTGWTDVCVNFLTVLR